MVRGDQGLAAAGRRGLVVIDTSTLSLETKQAAARFLAGRV